MSHFNIIQLAPERISRDERITGNAIYEDPLVLEKSDYAGEEKRYDEVIGEISRDVRPFARVNRRKRTLTFRSKETVKKYYMGVIDAAYQTHKEAVNCGFGYPFWMLRNGIDGGNTLWYVHGYCQRQMDVICDYLFGDVPKVLHIGSVLDAHR